MSQNADESDLKEDYPSQLRDSLRCQILLKLVLRLPRLTVIPRTVFEHMPLLEVLDLSGTSIQSLPSSVSSLSSLKELLLRDCSFLIELPIEIGMLTKLKLLDIEGSEIMYIPKEIVELTDLEVLRLCLSRYAEYYIKAKNVNGGVKVPRMMISDLKKLKELCISVCQEAEWWEKEIKEIQDEICHLENLEFLKWYLPTDTTLKQFLDIQINRKPAYEKLSNFTFTIGQHAQLTSCLPRGLEKKFAEFEKCLKWINAEGNIYDISKIMTRAKALFLSRHWTIVNLSAFDISKLKYFLLAECNEMETLVKIDDLSEVVENNKKGGLESLEYLSIHCMEKLKSIWEGPISKDSLSRLRILALHTCLELTTIFTPRIAQNLPCLAELTVEECPKVRSLISTPHSEHGPLFPSLERIFLIDLPELDHIFGGLIVLEKLESLMIYNCVKLRRLSEMELPRIQKIKGENKWWNSLIAYAPTWEKVFEPLKEKSELIKQLCEATNSLQHFHDVISHEAKDEKPLDGPGLGAQETKTEPFNFLLRKEEGRFHTLPGDRKKRRMRQRKVTAVQKLYDVCSQVFANCGPGVIPSADGIKRLTDILNDMTELDVGVRRNMPYFKVKETEGFPKITYLHLSECDKFSIGIFLLPPSGVLPLHNHPQMTVFSKLLFGTMHIKAYDWVDDAASMATPKADSSEAVAGPVSVRLAKVSVNSDFTAPCNTTILYPTHGGNMHCFTALTACAVLDVLCPPYCDPDDRHCQYYRTHPYTDFTVDDKKLPDDEKIENYAWLEDIDKPAGLSVVGALYNGPKII